MVNLSLSNFHTNYENCLDGISHFDRRSQRLVVEQIEDHYMIKVEQTSTNIFKRILRILELFYKPFYKPYNRRISSINKHSVQFFSTCEEVSETNSLKKAIQAIHVICTVLTDKEVKSKLIQQADLFQDRLINGKSTEQEERLRMQVTGFEQIKGKLKEEIEQERNELKKEIEQKRGELEKEIEQKQNELTKKEGETLKLRSQILSLEKKKNELKTSVSDLNEKIEKLEEKVAQLRQEAHSLEGQQQDKK